MIGRRAMSDGGRAIGSSRSVRRLCAAAALLAPIAHRPPPIAAQTHILIISGLGGEAKYRDSFSKLASTLADAANKRLGVPDAEIIWLGEDSVSKAPRYKGQSTKANIERELQRLAQRSGPNDQLALVLIGHGSGEGDDAKISLPGPDLSARDFAQLLGRFTTQRVAFIDLTSASGDMLPVISGPNRVVITATKSAFERNESHFGEYFVQAFATDGADTDKDGRVSLLEAFRYASAETKRLYENETRMQTEHPQLDDNGDKTGNPDPDGRTGEGVLARRFFLDAGGSAAARAASNDPRLAGLYAEKFAIEERLESLKGRKASMSAEAYDDQLEKVLVDLALKARSIREIEGRKE
jgi:hypothetical protein